MRPTVAVELLVLTTGCWRPTLPLGPKARAALEIYAPDAPLGRNARQARRRDPRIQVAPYFGYWVRAVVRRPG